MTARTHGARRVEPHTADIAPRVEEFWTALAATLRVAQRIAQSRVDSRRERARLAMLGVPLGLMASLLGGQLDLALPLTACAWWWAPRAWGWEWLVALGRGILGTEWAALGASALVAWPGQRLTIGFLWAGPVAMMGTIASLQRVR